MSYPRIEELDNGPRPNGAFFGNTKKLCLPYLVFCLMVGFLIGGVVSQSQRATEWRRLESRRCVDGKRASETDLVNLRYARLHLRNFMQAVNMTAAQKGATPQRTLGIPNTVAEDNLVQTSILAQQAKDLGMAVSDDAVIDFLEAYSQGTLNKGEFARLLQNATQNRMPQNQFFDAMRRELLAVCGTSTCTNAACCRLRRRPLQIFRAV